jgi:hypothetical protein
MQPIDYGRSFVTTHADFNSPRFLIESRCRIIDDNAGTSEDFCQGASCKSEDTFAERDLFYEENYDFLPVFGETQGIIFRRKAFLNENYRSVQPVESMWGGPIFRLVDPEAVRELATTQDIREATHAGLPIVTQTEISNEATSLRALIECPVKTMNISDERDLYQVDTGPVLFPDLSQAYDTPADRLSLAFIAFNAPHFADFVIEAPTPLLCDGEEVGRVHHYSRRVSLKATHRVFAFE